jgi:hypothetical protein
VRAHAHCSEPAEAKSATKSNDYHGAPGFMATSTVSNLHAGSSIELAPIRNPTVKNSNNLEAPQSDYSDHNFGQARNIRP